MSTQSGMSSIQIEGTLLYFLNPGLLSNTAFVTHHAYPQTSLSCN
jgi:hypothetical protein